MKKILTLFGAFGLSLSIGTTTSCSFFPQEKSNLISISDLIDIDELTQALGKDGKGATMYDVNLTYDLFVVNVNATVTSYLAKTMDKDVEFIKSNVQVRFLDTDRMDFDPILYSQEIIFYIEGIDKITYINPVRFYWSGQANLVEQFKKTAVELNKTNSEFYKAIDDKKINQKNSRYDFLPDTDPDYFNDLINETCSLYTNAHIFINEGLAHENIELITIEYSAPDVFEVSFFGKNGEFSTMQTFSLHFS